MESTVTIKTRTVMLTLLVMSAVLVAYFVGSARPGGGAASAAESESSADAAAPSIVMTGSGEASGVPDQLVFDVRVSETAGDVSTALSGAANTARQVLAALGDLDIPAKDVQTTGLSVQPQYDYSGDGQPVLIGYGASESLSILVRSLPDAGDAISAAVEAGGNAIRVSNVRLKIGDVDALLGTARDDAVEEAKAKAQQYAEATGSELGSVVSIKEVSASPRVYEQLAYRSVADFAAASVPIRAGSEKLKVTVKIVWSLA
jgi:uncharacterized protein YggE